MNSKNIVIV